MRSFFWSVFSCIRTEYGDLLRRSPYLVLILEDADQKKLRIWAPFTQCTHSVPLFWLPTTKICKKRLKTGVVSEVYMSPKWFNLHWLSLSYFFYFCAQAAAHVPMDTWRNFNIHKAFRRCQWRLLNVLCTFDLNPVSSWVGSAK